MLFDGAWRMMNGQQPHIDFYSHLGFLTYAPTVVGLWLSHGTAWALGYGQALVALVLGTWAYILGRRRLADVPFAAFCLTAVFMAAAPFAIGFWPMRTSPGMLYNRQGYVLISLLLVEAFHDSERDTPGESFRGGVSTGAIIAILFFLKITYFAAALFLLAALLPCCTQSKSRWRGIATGLVALTILCSAYSGFRLAPMIHDLLLIAGGKHIRFGTYMLNEIFRDAAVAGVLAVSAALLLRVCEQRQHSKAIAIGGLAMAFAGTALVFGNAELTGVPLSVFLAILVLDRMNPHVREKQIASDFFQVSVLLLGSVLIVASLFEGALSVGYALDQRFSSNHTATVYKSPVLNGFTAGWEEAIYAKAVNDGLVLVSKNKRVNDSLMALDFTNPFSYGLKMRPAYGGATVLQFGTTFDARHKPTPKFLIGYADLVIVPKKSSDTGDQFSLPQLYGPYLKSHFFLVDESTDWRLYRRNGE